MAKKRLNEDLIVVVAVDDEFVVAMTDAQDNHVKAVVMLELLNLVKPKVQLIALNDLTVNAEDVLHVVVPVEAQEVNDDSIVRVVIQNHPKSHSRKKKDLEPETGELLRTNFKVRQKRLKVKLKAKRLKNQRKKQSKRMFHHLNQKRRQ